MKGELTTTVERLKKLAERRKWTYEQVSPQTIKLSPPPLLAREPWINVMLGQSDERVTRAYLMKPEGETITARRIYGGVKGITAAVRSVRTGEELKNTRKKGKSA